MSFAEERIALNALLFTLSQTRSHLLTSAFGLRRGKHRELQDRVVDLSLKMEEILDSLVVPKAVSKKPLKATKPKRPARANLSGKTG